MDFDVHKCDTGSDDEEEKCIDNIVEDWIKQSEKIPLSFVSASVLLTISRYFTNTPIITTANWKSLATSLGIDDTQILNEIEGDAAAKQLWPSEMLLWHCASDTKLMFSDVLIALHKKLIRKDVLQRLHDVNCVQAFLDAWDKESLIKCQHDEKQFSSTPTKMLSILKSMPQRRLIILLTYSTDVNEQVYSLIQRLWKENIGVISEYTLKNKGYFETNLVSSWDCFYKQSHLIVPVISKKYLMDIKHPSHYNQSRGVRFVYDLYTRDYISNGCLNKKVRPLVLDNLHPKSLVGVNPTLEIRWQLDKNWDSFVEMLISWRQEHLE